MAKIDLMEELTGKLPMSNHYLQKEQIKEIEHAARYGAR